MRIDIFSIFPQYLDALKLSLIGKAINDGLIGLSVHDLRNWTYDRHRTVDDTPYGGGAGMVMKPEPWGQALEWLLNDYQQSPIMTQQLQLNQSTGYDVDRPILIITSPSGKLFNQEIAYELAGQKSLAFACGRYEGIDARVGQWAANHFRVMPLSIGDYVLNGGEVAALVMIEAIVRLIPGVIGNPESLIEESYSQASQGLLEYPVYTKPANWRGISIPEILLSGHHANIAEWRRQQSLEITKENRPDLLEQRLN